MQVGDGALCVRRGLENRTLVRTEDRRPALDISSVVRTGFELRHYAEIGAEHSRAQFGDQLFDRIGVGAEPLSEIAITAVLGTGPVQLMPISA